MSAKTVRAKVFTLLLIVAIILPTVSPSVAGAMAPTRQAASSPAATDPLLSPPPAPSYTASSPLFRLPALAINVTSTPEEVPAGGVVTFTVRLANAGNDVAHGVILSGTLPADLECVRCGGFYSPGNRKLQWTVGTLEEGQVLTYTFAAQVGEGAAWEEGTALSLSARGVEVPRATRSSAVIKVPYPLSDGATEVVLSPGREGQLASADGRVIVTFPAEAVATTLTVVYTPTAPVRGPGWHNSLRTFHLNAYDSLGQEVNSFPAPVEIEYRYTWAETLERDVAEQLYLSHWDENQETWVYVPTEADTANQRLVARTAHFSTFSWGEYPLPSDDYLPQLKDFQEIDLFSGAASYSYPLSVPPGRGGLTPQLALSYSSGSVDWPASAWEHETQASWVGYGWSLEPSYVGRQNVGGLPTIISENQCIQGAAHQGWDTFSLVLNGSSHDLVLGADGAYHTMDETYWRIWSEGTDRWRARTKDGTLYTFEEKMWQELDGDRHIYKWLLSEVEDRHGNRIEYSYFIQEVGCTWGPGHEAAYLSEITYNFNGGSPLTRIEFVRAKRGDNYAPKQDNRCPDRFRQEYHLVQINEWTWVGGAWQIVRQYLLGHDYTTFDDDPSDPEWGKLTLRSVQECYWAGMSFLCMPETTFTYHPQGTPEDPYPGRNRLATVENGFGGRMSFTYEPITDIHGSRNRVTSREVEDGMGNAYTWTYTYEGEAKNTPKNIACPDGISEDAGAIDDWAPRARVHQEFRGHSEVVVTDPEGNRQLHRFWQDDTLRGKEYYTEQQDASGNAYYREENTYAYVEEPTSQSGYNYATPEIAFVYVSQKVERNLNGDGSPGVQRTTKYYYDTQYQDGDQYGNLTRVEEFGEIVDPEPLRTTLKVYCPNPDPNVWIVDRVQTEKLFFGSAASGQWLSWTEYAYDEGVPFQTQLPTVGELTRVARVAQDLGGGQVRTTQESYDYDFAGNKTRHSTYGSWQICTVGVSCPEPGDRRDTRIYYDTSGSGYHLFPERVEYPHGFYDTATYDYRLGVLTTYTDLNFQTTAYYYDDFGRVIKVVRPGDSFEQPTTQISYVNWGYPGLQHVRVQQRERSSQNGTVDQEQYFDGLGQLIQTHLEDEDGKEVIQTTLYDGLGRTKATVVPFLYDATTAYVAPGSNPRTQTAYDPLGRVRLVTNTDGTTIATSYRDWKVGTIDENGHLVVRENDPLGRLWRVMEYEGTWSKPLNWAALPQEPYAETTYQYDYRDLLARVIDDAGNDTTIGYDNLGRKTTMNDPDMGAWSYNYDAPGNLVTQTDARGKKVCFYYDSSDRLIGKAYPIDGLCPTWASLPIYTYDDTTNGNYGRGRRTGMSDASGTTSWVYDARGRIRKETKSIDGEGTFTTEWWYDAMDRVEWMAYPAVGGYVEIVLFYYNSAGQVERVAGNGTYVNDITYDPAGRVDTRVLGDDVLDTAYMYYAWATPNGRGRLQHIATSPHSSGPESGGDNLQWLEYSYDAVGNVTELQDHVGGDVWQYGYDDLDRLTSADLNGNMEEYEYNEIGNLVIKGAWTYTYPDAGLPRPHAVTVKDCTSCPPPATYLFDYDANGNQTRRAIPLEGTYDLQYDGENRLTWAGLNDQEIAEFIYDGDGNRVKGAVNGVTTVYIGVYLEVEKNQGTTIYRKYYYAGGSRVAMSTQVGFNVSLYWLLSDHLGSTTLTTDENGEFVDELRYDAWGATRSGSAPTTYRYTGQRQEEALGLYYYGARWYDPALARFVQADTVVPNRGDPQSFNRYSYVRNNPLRYVDPTGHYYYDPGCDCLVYQGRQDSGHLDYPEYTDMEPDWSSYQSASPTSPDNQFIPSPVISPPTWDANGNALPPQTAEGDLPGHWGPSTHWPGQDVYIDSQGREWRPDKGYTNKFGNEGEQPHWHTWDPSTGDEDTYPPAEGEGGYKWGRRGQRKNAGEWNREKQIFEAIAVVVTVGGAAYVGYQILRTSFFGLRCSGVGCK